MSDNKCIKQHGINVSETELMDRTKKAQYYMKENNIDALLFTDESNFLYFTGLYTKFWFSPTRPYYLIIPKNKNPIVIVPTIVYECFAFKTWLGPENVKTWVHPSDQGLGEELVVKTITDLGESGNIGFMMGEGSYLRVPLEAIETIKNSIIYNNWNIVNGTPLIEKLRSIKSQYEINCLKKVCNIASEAFKTLPVKIKELYSIQGYVSEKDVQRIMKISLLTEGADSAPYVMVQSGEDGYDNIILEPTERLLKNGDVLIIDVGCVYRGYWSDFDRNFSIGNPSKIVSESHKLLWDCTNTGFNSIKIGTLASDLYNSMVNSISKPTGRFGHGIGLQLTEHFSILPTDHTVLVDGMVITLEPGLIMENGKIMVHEENVLITTEGPVYISKRVERDIEIIELKNEYNEKFEYIYENKKWNDELGTLSGGGSTVNINSYRIKWLGDIIKKYNITNVLDACGDCNWQRLIPNLDTVNYLGVDVSNIALKSARLKNIRYPHMNFSEIPTDIEYSVTVQENPESTLLILKEVIQHMPLNKGLLILQKAKKAGIRYLAVTNHDRGLFPGKNTNIPIGSFYTNNMFEVPFCLENCLENCNDLIPFKKRASHGNICLFDLQNCNNI